MNQIAEFELPELQNEEHFQFMTQVHDLIGKHCPDVLQIDDLYRVFKTALKREADILGADMECKLSKLVHDYDQRCECTCRAIIDKVKAYLQSPYPQEVENARMIKPVLDLYSNFRYSSLIKHASLISELVTELQKKENACYVDFLGLTNWVEELKTQNQQLLSVLEERNLECIDHENGDTRLIRIESDLLYLEIVNKVNAFFTLKMAPSIAEQFAHELNLKIKSYKSSDQMNSLIHTMSVKIVF